MFGRTSQKVSITAESYRKARDVVFLELRHTVFCTECELISYNNSSRCLACGSLAVLSLARVLGGSLHGEERARMVSREEQTIEAPRTLATRPSALVPWSPRYEPAYAVALQAGARPGETTATSVLQFGVDRARALTGAAGAALAMHEGSRLVCRARSGSMAPDLGVEVGRNSVTAVCARSGQLWRSHDTERDPWVNRESCRALGIRSLVVAPVIAVRNVIGILEAFSPEPQAFDDEQTATVQLMASAIALGSVRRAQPMEQISGND